MQNAIIGLKEVWYTLLGANESVNNVIKSLRHVLQGLVNFVAKNAVIKIEIIE